MAILTNRSTKLESTFPTIDDTCVPGDQTINGDDDAGEIRALSAHLRTHPDREAVAAVAHLGGEVEIFAKREDCNSGLAFGGNKLRKLEYIVPDAIATNADTLVSIGGVQSNHTRMVAAVAAKIGMKCRLVQESWVPHEDAVYDRVGNILLSRVMGAEIAAGRRRLRHRHPRELGRARSRT